MPTENVKKARFLVIGLDGASFNLIQNWLDDGTLPNFRRLVDEGASGESESCIPPVTMPAWRVYSTGKYPGKLGVFWHQQLDPETLEVQTPNSTFFKTADFWDYLNGGGLRTGILGMPDTFPPRPLDGFLVAGGPSAAETGYVYPPRLEATLASVGYQPHHKGDFYYAAYDSPVVQQALEVVQKTFDTASLLLDQEQLDFLQVVSFDINRIQHFFYDEEPTRRAWQIADAWLGKVRERFEYVMIMSDHGTERVRRTFFLNVWLRQNGYLTTRFHPGDIPPRLGINRTNIGRIASALGLTKRFSYETLLKYSALLPSATGVFGEFGNQHVAKRIDWSRTRAFALAQGPLYINRRVVKTDQEYEALRDELIFKLEDMRDPESNQPVFKKVYRREDLYHGPYASRAPHLLALNHDPFHNRAGLSQPDVFAKSWRWKGNNRHYGLFMLAGPGVRAGRVEGARLVDLAPTILHLCGVAVPDDMDGKVLEQALEAEPGARVPVLQGSLSMNGTGGDLEEDYDQAVRSRLEGLGYL